ncbi:hypothetical protein BDV11DRAFT_171755 [Aspergillus similis]
MNCSSDWQWQLANNGSVEFDADIVGPGVIAGFIATSLVAVITLIVAFTTYSVPTELINDVDGVISRALRSAFTFIRTTLHIPSITKTDGEEARDDRLRAFQTFMLSVSDQVLASELAILFATIVRHKDITLYSVNVVVALGCLASTVHLAMMPLLVRQMREHHVVKASRSISMVAATTMLVFLLVLQISDTWRDGTHIYFYCAFHDFQVDKDRIGENWIEFAMQLLVPTFIIYSNYEVLRLLYSRKYVSGPEDSSQASQTANPLQRRHKISRLRQGLSEMWMYSLQSRIRRLWARDVANKKIRTNISPKSQRNCALVIAETWTFYECQESFLWRILWLISGNVYGIADVFSTRSNTAGMSGDRDKMGYGQIVPLVLLILPVFAAIQSIYDYRDRIKSQQRHEKVAEQPVTSANTTNSPVGDDSIHQAIASSVRADSWSAPGQLSRSTTTSTQAHSPSTASRRRTSILASNHTLNLENIPSVYTSPTLELLEPPEQISQHHPGIDRSLWQWARNDNYQEMPFVREATYMHTAAMLAFVILFGWSMAAGPGLMVAIILEKEMTGDVRLDLVAERQHPTGYYQAMVQAQGADELVDDQGN